jgi:hypothetical protein
MKLFRKLPPRYASVAMPFVLSVLITGTVSIISILSNLGVSPRFLTAWPATWLLSWIVALPTGLAVLPLVRRIVGLVVAPPARTGVAELRAGTDAEAIASPSSPV